MAEQIDARALLKSKDAEALIGKLSFEQAMELLESLVAEVESGSFPLEESIQAYERGAKLVQHLRKQLSGAEERLKKVDLAALQEKGDGGERE
ncbi:MAG: exodeoxyribonuclease VII small subunit [Bdellovibrionota bacterium]|nr:MAG: exodeoxyribonuclease VII small subunit [Bdellovibrionota bacterium]